MFSLNKQVFIQLLNFCSSLETKCVSRMVKLKYYPFMISLDKDSETCNVLSSKI